MSTDSNSRLMSLLVCWAIHSGVLMFIGLSGLLMGMLEDPGAVLMIYEPLVGDAVVPFQRLIDLLVSGAVWVGLAGLVVGVAAVGGFRRTGWGRGVLLVVTWLHIVGLLPLLLGIHLKVGLSGIVGAIFVVAELATGIATIAVMKGSLKVIAKTDWGEGG
ncbi:MAG: hypothetical protein ACI8RZ_000369 [Myxococcota bacterium]|jgi:hypothetical protein